MKSVQCSISLFIFWLVISGSIKPLDLIVGVLLSALIGAWAARSLWEEEAPVLTIRQFGRLLLYIPYLIGEIVVAAVYVAEKVLDPKMPIKPVLITHRCAMERDVSRVAFANSVTLTPGTLTVDLSDDGFLIHCLAEEFSDTIASGALERRIIRVFEE